MKLIRPVIITDSMFVSSDLPEPEAYDPPLWSSGTTYALDATVRLASTHKKYKSVQAGNLNHDPATDTTATWWTDIGGVARWAMFDTYVSTYSSRNLSLAATIKPGVVDSLFLYGMVGTTAVVEMRDGLGGPIVYSRTLNLLVPKINDWYAYYFEPSRQVPYFVLTDLPPYANGHITLTVTSSGFCNVGMMAPGRTFYVGETRYGVQVGIRDYSRKTVDADGFVSLVKRNFAKTMRAQVRLPQTIYPEVQEMLESLRATPVVWIGDSDGAIQPLVVYGFYKDMMLTVDLPTAGIYALEVEGMV